MPLHPAQRPALSPHRAGVPAMTARTVADRDFRLFLVGQLASVFGGTLTTTAISVIAVTGLGAGPRDVSLVVAAGMLPALLFGPVCGVLLDRVRRPRRALIVADLGAAAMVGACAVAGLTGTLNLGWLVALNVVLGVVHLTVNGLYFSHLHSLGVSDVGRARGRLQSSEMLASSVAGSLAGPVAAGLGAAVLFVGDALAYLFSAYCLVRLRSPDHRPPSGQARKKLTEELADGLRALRGNRLLLGYAGFLVLSGVAASGIATQRAVFLLDTVALPVALYTLPTVLATLLGAGGALLAPRLLARGHTPRRLLLVGLSAAAVAGAVLPLAGGPLGWVVTVSALSIALPLFFGGLANIALVTVIADDVGDSYFARITTLLGSVGTLANTAGALLGGVLGEALGTRGGIWTCVGVNLVAVAVLLAVAGRRPARSATDPVAADADHARATPGPSREDTTAPPGVGPDVEAPRSDAAQPPPRTLTGGRTR
ncbi:Na+/melibiose symporter [Actinoalloteichus cyanogriseus DSM 43889]|uniref:Na+/melibiose symporter n=2 Tax=Actinoalloteichus cyanogriseus TaxID=2893586 RepID=A0ABT1JFA5_ACTCY|nr:Na+/melibiose symporter [Actinoalloteichus caeruleus DSM 43889]